MFLENLSYEQKKVFLGLAKHVLLIDDAVIDEKEKYYLRAICVETILGLDDAYPSVDSLQKLPEIFTKESEQKMVIVELIATALSNNQYHDNQKKFIAEVAEKFGKSSLLEDAEKVMENFALFREEVIQFIFGKEIK